MPRLPPTLASSFYSLDSVRLFCYPRISFLNEVAEKMVPGTTCVKSLVFYLLHSLLVLPCMAGCEKHGKHENPEKHKEPEVSVVAPTPADFAVVGRIESYFAPPKDSASPETLTFRALLSSRMSEDTADESPELPPSLTDALVIDLLRHCKLEKDKKLESAACVGRAVKEYETKGWEHIAGLRPWTHKMFVRSLTPKERESLVRVAVDYARRGKVRETGGQAVALCEEAQLALLDCGVSLDPPTNIEDFVMDDQGRFVVLSPYSLWRLNADKKWIKLNPVRAYLPNSLQSRGKSLFWATGSKIVAFREGKQKTLLSEKTPIDGLYVVAEEEFWAISGKTLVRYTGGKTTRQNVAEIVPDRQLGERLAFYGLFPDPNNPESQAMMLFAFTDPVTYNYLPKKLYRATLQNGKWSVNSGVTYGSLGRAWGHLVLRCGERRWYSQVALGIETVIADVFGQSWRKAKPYEQVMLPSMGFAGAARCYKGIVYVLGVTRDGTQGIYRLPDGFGLKPKTPAAANTVDKRD